MKRIKGTFFIILISSICSYVCISYQKSNNDTCFSGEIQLIEDNIKNVEKMKLKSVLLEGANYGWFSVNDSLMIFMNPKLKNHYYQIFNVDTGKEIGSFCEKGGGPNEVTAINPIFQFFRENDELKTLLFAPNEEKLLIWNITQSIKQGKTAMDKIIPYTWKEENKGACYNHLFLQDKNTLLAKVSVLPIGNNDATLPIYQRRTINTNECLESYLVYKHSIKNSESYIMPETFFYSHDGMKPDGTKLVQAMLHLPQLNIIDMQTGKVVGYRLDDNVDFTVFEGRKEIKNYYSRLQTDDNYIYVLYRGIALDKINTVSGSNLIYVFDWNGRLVRKIAVDHVVNEMWIDTVRNRLYISEPVTDDIFYCELDAHSEGY